MAQETENGIEIKDIKPINEPGNNETHAKKSTSIPEKIASFFQFFTVEPFLLCYILPSVISALAVQKLNLEKACRVDLNYTEDICSQIIAGEANDNITRKALEGAQKMVADMTIWKEPLQRGIPAIVILFVGSWSDRTGNRKALMLTPIIGELISALGLILTTYFFLEWPLWITALIEAIPAAFTGGISIALMGSYSFIADATTEDSRTFRIGIVGVIVTLGIPLGSALSGVLTQTLGYYGVFSIGLVIYALGFTHTFFRVHNIKEVPTKGTFIEKVFQFFHPKNAWSTLSLLFLSERRELFQIWLVVGAHIVVIGPVFGESAVLFLYTLGKFHMDVYEFSLFSTYSVLMGLAGTAVAVTVFSKYLGMHDGLIGVIATTSRVVSSFVYGLAPNRTWFYTGPVFDFFANSGTAVVRSLGTKVVNPENIGKMCSLIGFVEAVVPVIYTPIYSKVYSAYLETIPGLFYIVGGIMTIPAILIFLSLYFIDKRRERDLVKHPDLKEIHAHENDLTVL